MSKKDFVSDMLFLNKMEQLAIRLRELTQMEENDQTHYTGADLNILDRLNEKIADETITEEDILEVERLAFKFL